MIGSAGTPCGRTESPPLVEVLAVIHYLDDETTFAQAAIAHKAGAAGVFLIAHGGPADDDRLPGLANDIKHVWPAMKTGFNLLSRRAFDATRIATQHGVDMVWLEHPGVSSGGLDAEGARIAEFLRSQPNQRAMPEIFASVAFKYQRMEENPAKAAHYARVQGWRGYQPPKRRRFVPDKSWRIRTSDCRQNSAQRAQFRSHVRITIGVQKGRARHGTARSRCADAVIARLFSCRIFECAR